MSEPRIERFRDEDAEAVLAFWRREDAMPEEVARERVGEVHLVAREDDAVVGTTSAYLRRNDQLRLPMWYYRVFVGAARRRDLLGERLGYAARDDLGARFASGEDRRASGIVFEVENRVFEHAPEARWRALGFAFIGLNEYGEHVRVHYFPGARAPLYGST